MDDTINALCAINNHWLPGLVNQRDDDPTTTVDSFLYDPQQFVINAASTTTSIERDVIADFSSTSGWVSSGGSCSTGSFVQTVIVPAVCAFGVLGNLLTLIVLSRRRLTVVCVHSERRVHVGLRALAVSDLLVCVCQLPQAFIGQGCLVYTSKSFQLVYWTYSGAVINTFLLASVWLIVTMAVERYLTTARPFSISLPKSMTAAKVSAVGVFVASFLLNLPRLFEFRIEKIVCGTSGIGGGRPVASAGASETVDFSESDPLAMSAAASGTISKVNLTSFAAASVKVQDQFEIYMQVPGWLHTVDQRAESAYLWIYFGFGVCMPVTLLAVGNCGLVVALRRASRGMGSSGSAAIAVPYEPPPADGSRRRLRHRRRHVLGANDRVTSILVSVVVAYVVLVTPAEVLMFVERQLLPEQLRQSSITGLATAFNITNLLQTVNFSFNFVLYVALNLQFRRTIQDLICCWSRRKAAAAAAAAVAALGDRVPAAASRDQPRAFPGWSCCHPSPPATARRVYFNRHPTMKAFASTTVLR